MHRRGLRRGALVVLVAGMVAAAGLRPAAAQSTPTPTGTLEATRRGAVAAEHPRAAEIGLEMLRRGGNAVDAAIATAYAVCVLNLSSCGIGGGGFMLVWDGKGGAFALDYRETAPRKAHRDLFRTATDSDHSRRGGLAAGTPGEVAGMEAARERFARLDRRTLMAPAIALARDGFPVGPHLAHEIASNLTAIRSSPSMAALLLEADGTPLAEGDRITLPLLAATLERVAAQGMVGFYRGVVAKEIATAVQAAGGLMTTQDLVDYKPIWREPLRADVLGYQMLTMPPPSSGGVVLEMLQILGDDDLRALGRTSPAYLHLLAETMGHGFADRARWYGDPKYTRVPLAKLLAPSYAQALRARIHPDRTQPPERYGSSPDAGTTHVSVMDDRGMAVGLTTTINTAFGAMLVAGETGVLMNNEMDDFAIAPGVPNAFGLIGGEANAIAPGKRPLSSMSPVIALHDGRPRLVAGGSGGPLIVSATLQSVLGVLAFGQDPVTAVSAPRIHHQWMPRVLAVEAGIDAATQAALTQRGHTVKPLPFAGAVSMVVAAPDGTFSAAADPRKKGGVAAW